MDNTVELRRKFSPRRTTCTTLQLIDLPPEVHLHILSYLHNVDSAILGLTCKRLYFLYFPGSAAFAPHYSLWWLPGDGHKPDKESRRRWLTRNAMLPYLNAWIERVTGEAWLRSRWATFFPKTH